MPRVTPKEQAGRQLFEEFLSDLDSFWDNWGAIAYDDFEVGAFVNCEDYGIPDRHELHKYYDEAHCVRQHFEELAIQKGLVHGGFVEQS